MFASVVGDIIVILQLFALLKAPTLTCFKWTFFKFIVSYPFSHIPIFIINFLQLPSFWDCKARFKVSSPKCIPFQKNCKTPNERPMNKWLKWYVYICYEENLRIWWNIRDCITCWNEILKIAWLCDKDVLKWPIYYGIYIHSRFIILLKPNFKLIIFIIYCWTYSHLGLAHCFLFN